ncbi:MAG TPA: glutathione S-transferase family protein [Solimonas sp.]
MEPATLPTLFYGVPQGCSFGSIVALEWLGEPYRLCRIEMLEQPWDPLFARVNPLMKTPALLVDGETLSESLSIQLHLAARGIGRGLGFAQGTRDYDRLTRMLGYLNTDFFASFAPLWLAYESGALEPQQEQFLRGIGRDEVVRQCAYLDRLLADRRWLLGETRSLADAYFSGIGRWVGYMKLFDTQREYPNLHRYLQALGDDAGVRFARNIEKDPHTARGTAFRGHVTLQELEPLLPRIQRPEAA